MNLFFKNLNLLLFLVFITYTQMIVAAEPFFGKASALPNSVKKQMIGQSWHQGCPVGLDQLSYLQLSYWGFDNKVHIGELVVHQRVAQEIIDIFKQLYAAHFPIEKMILPEKLVKNKKFNTPVDMMNYVEAADDTSAYFCRIDTQSPQKQSAHSFGIAIDINPFYNPSIIDQGKTEPAAAGKYLDRNISHIGMIKEGDRVFNSFLDRGWIWGGFFSSGADYMHFNKIISRYYSVEKLKYNPPSQRISGIPAW